MVFVYYNNLQHFTVTNHTPLKSRVKLFSLPAMPRNQKAKEKMPSSCQRHVQTPTLQAKKKTKQESPSSFQERRTGMLQIETLSSTEAFGKSDISKNLHTPEMKRDCYEGYDDSECSNKCRCAFCQKKRRLAMLHDIIANASKM